MGEYSFSTNMMKNLSESDNANTSAVDKGLNLMACTSLQHISGIASIETVRGLNEFYIKYSRVHGYTAVAICLFGVLSNSANIIVLTRKNMASSTNTLLLWLAVADLLTMIDYLPFAIHFYIMKPFNAKRPDFSTSSFPWICFLLFHASFSIVCHTVAIWLTITLAIFRYIYICKPTSGAYYCSQQRACWVVVVVIILTIILCIPNYAVNTYNCYPNSCIMKSMIKDTGNLSDLNRSNSSDDYYYFPNIRTESQVNMFTNLVNSWVQAILFKLVPCFMLVTLTLLLLHAMHKAYRKRMKLKSQGRRAESDRHGEHNRTTGMLLAVVVLFTLTELPQGILTLMNIFVTCFLHVVYNKLGDLLDIMALINNSVNFVLYCTMSKQFRTTFMAIFCPQRPTRSKWLKMRLIKSQHGKTCSNEVTDGVNGKIQSRNNSRTAETTDSDKKMLETTGNDLSCSVVLKRNLDTKTEINDLFVNNDKKSPSVVSSNGISTHTHGYFPDHSHV